MATIGVLLRKDEAAMVGNTSLASDRRAPTVAPSVRRTTGVSAPVFSTARAKTKRAATVIGAGLAKPAKACSGVTIPATSTATIPPTIAAAGATTSRTRTTSTMTTTVSVNQASQVNASLPGAHPAEVMGL